MNFRTAARAFALAIGFVCAGTAAAQYYGDDHRDGRYDPRRSSVIRCESVDERQRFCSTGGADVEIVRQISRTRCVEGMNWGSDRRGVWVAGGCRADFAVVDRGYGHRDGRERREERRGNRGYDRRDDGRYDRYDDRRYDRRDAYRNEQGYGGGGGRQLRCESRDFRRQFCRVPGLRAADIVHQISRTRCQFNGNWGYNREGIWVDQGCAAQFVIR